MWRRRMDTNISLRTNLFTLCHTFANEEEEDDGVYKIVVPWVPWALCENPFCPKTGRCCCLFAVMAIPIPIFPLHSREVLQLSLAGSKQDAFQSLSFEAYLCVLLCSKLETKIHPKVYLLNDPALVRSSRASLNEVCTK